MINPEELLIQLEQEATNYPDGSYMSNLLLETCIVIRSAIQDKECLNESNEKLTKMLSESINKYEELKKAKKFNPRKKK